MIPRSLLRRLNRWLDQHLPFYCPECRTWHWSKDARKTFTTTGIAVLICRECWHNLYEPWSQ